MDDQASSRRKRPLSLLTSLILVAGLVTGVLAARSATAAPTTAPAAAPAPAAATITPAAVGGLDCNGYSPLQDSVKPEGSMVCAEVHGGSANGHLFDNGNYIGHDEPLIQFYSNQPGSSTDVAYTQTLPRDPRALPTVNSPGQDVTHFFELMPALWYSMDLCDPNSYPQLPCAPDSDTNTPSGSNPGGGSAFLELQFYPPGFAPFIDGLSCDGTHWCAALTIDSLECSNGFTSCNNNCVEPVNFAWVQTNGVPTGPPSPQLQDSASFTPNRSTLLMNPGDKLSVKIFDNRKAGALETSIQDLTTHKSGYMLASAANGFASTSMATCDGTPWSFRPLYSTASTANQGGWALANINVSYEIGHFEACTSLAGPISIPVSSSYSDPSFSQCNGPYESTTSGDPSNAEGSDAPCFLAGDTHGPLTAAPDEVTGCTVGNGDLDYDGSSYWRDWPDSVVPGKYPSPMLISPPSTVHGAPYPRMQFLTDNPATNSECSPPSTANCQVPPPQAPGGFYPYWTFASVGHGSAGHGSAGHDNGCAWEFGQMTNGNSFGGDAQWGVPTILNQIINLGVMDEGPIMPSPHCARR
jgi:hypothetical protein